MGVAAIRVGLRGPSAFHGLSSCTVGRDTSGPNYGRALGSNRFDRELTGYAKRTEDELLATARLIAGLYASMDNFPLFVSLSLLYFAAASFTETARRLDRPHLASSFLLHEHPSFAAQSTDLLKRARLVRGRDETDSFNEDLRRAIELFNVAGFGRGNPPKQVSGRCRRLAMRGVEGRGGS
jgi:FADH2 O2-dependent halogenase